MRNVGRTKADRIFVTLWNMKIPWKKEKLEKNENVCCIFFLCISGRFIYYLNSKQAPKHKNIAGVKLFISVYRCNENRSLKKCRAEWRLVSCQATVFLSFQSSWRGNKAGNVKAHFLLISFRNGLKTKEKFFFGRNPTQSYRFFVKSDLSGYPECHFLCWRVNIASENFRKENISWIFEHVIKRLFTCYIFQFPISNSSTCFTSNWFRNVIENFINFQKKNSQHNNEFAQGWIVGKNNSKSCWIDRKFHGNIFFLFRLSINKTFFSQFFHPFLRKLIIMSWTVFVGNKETMRIISFYNSYVFLVLIAWLIVL